MSYLSDIRLHTLEGTRENLSWASGCALGLNIYAYAAGDPINGTDPSGLAPGDGNDHEPLSLGGGGCGGCEGSGGGSSGSVGGVGGGGGGGSGGGAGASTSGGIVRGDSGSCTGACAVDAAARQRVVNFINNNDNGASFFSAYSGIGYDQNGMAYSEGGQSNYLADVGDVLGKIWNVPNDAIGLVVGAVEAGSGLIAGNNVHIGFGDDALQISGGDIGSGAITFGNVQLFNGYDRFRVPITPDYDLKNSYTPGEVRMGAHESGHSAQSEVLGPAFFPAYVAAGLINGGLISARNPFERSADFYGRGMGGPFSGF